MTSTLQKQLFEKLSYLRGLDISLTSLLTSLDNEVTNDSLPSLTLRITEVSNSENAIFFSGNCSKNTFQSFIRAEQGILLAFSIRNEVFEEYEIGSWLANRLKLSAIPEGFTKRLDQLKLAEVQFLVNFRPFAFAAVVNGEAFGMTGSVRLSFESTPKPSVDFDLFASAKPISMRKLLAENFALVTKEDIDHIPDFALGFQALSFHQQKGIFAVKGNVEGLSSAQPFSIDGEFLVSWVDKKRIFFSLHSREQPATLEVLLEWLAIDRQKFKDFLPEEMLSKLLSTQLLYTSVDLSWNEQYASTTLLIEASARLFGELLTSVSMEISSGQAAPIKLKCNASIFANKIFLGEVLKILGVQPPKGLPDVGMMVSQVALDNSGKFSISASAEVRIDSLNISLVFNEISFAINSRARHIILSSQSELTVPLVFANEKITTTLSVFVESNSDKPLIGELKGALVYNDLKFAVHSKLGEKFFEASAEKIPVSEILKKLLGTDSPVEAVSDVLIEKLNLKIDKEKLLISGKAIANKQIKLGDKNITVASLEFNFQKETVQGTSKITANITLSGTPQWTAFEGLTLSQYSFRFEYKDRQWLLGGELMIEAFDRLISLEAIAAVGREGAEIVFNAVMSPVFEAKHFLIVSQYDSDKAARLFDQLISNGTLGNNRELSTTFNPTTLKLEPEFEKDKAAIIKVLHRNAPLIQIPDLLNLTENLILAKINPRSIGLKITKKDSSFGWKFGASGDMIINDPFKNGGQLISLEKGEISLYSEVGESGLVFTAANAELNPLAFFSGIPKELSESTRIALKKIKLTRKKSWEAFIEIALRLAIPPDSSEFLKKINQLFPTSPNGGLREITGTLGVSDEQGLMFKLTNNNGVEIPDLLGVIDDKKGILPQLGISYFLLAEIEFSLKKQFTFSITTALGLPSKLNDIFGNNGLKIFKTYVPGNMDSLVYSKLTLSTELLSGEILNSPFVDIRGITPTETAYKIDFDVLFGKQDLGAISVHKPKVKIDLKKGSFKFSGGYDIDQNRPISVPLQPVKRLLELLDLKKLADVLPPGIPIKTVKLDIPGFITFLRERNLALPETLEAKLLEVNHLIEKLPLRFREYLSINVPRELVFDFDVTPDGGVSFAMETKGKSDPLQFLIPSGPQLLGIRLKKIGFGTVLGGILAKFELSAELDQFDPMTMALAVLLPEENVELWKNLPDKNQLQRTLIIDDILVLVIYYSGIPIPIPLFYSDIAIRSLGFDGFELATSIRFPRPELNLVESFRMINDVRNAIANNQDVSAERPVTFEMKESLEERPRMNIVFRTGPLYLRLPKYFGLYPDRNGKNNGLLIGLDRKVELVNVKNTAAILFNTLRRQSIVYAVQSLALKHRIGKHKLALFQVIQLEMAWALTTPKEFTKHAYELLGEALEPQQTKDMLKLLPASAPGQPQLANEPDEGVVLFMLGRFAIAQVLNVRAVAAIVTGPPRFATGMELNASLSNNLFVMNMSGVVSIPHKKEDTGVYLTGSGALTILGSPILKGQFELKGEKLHVSATVDLQPLEAPIRLKGELNGIFSNNLFFLENKLEVLFWSFRMTGDATLKFAPDAKLIRLNGSMKFGEALDLSAWLIMQDDAAKKEIFAGFKLSGSIGSLIQIHAEGQTKVDAINAALALSITGSLSFANQKIFDGKLLIDTGKEIYDLDGRFFLFPEGALLNITGGIKGYISRDGFHLYGNVAISSSMMGGCFSQTWIDVYKHEARIKTHFLGIEQNLVISSQGNDFILQTNTSFGSLRVDGAFVIAKLGGSGSVHLTAHYPDVIYFDGRVALGTDTRGQLTFHLFGVPLINGWLLADQSQFELGTGFRSDFSIGGVLSGNLELKLSGYLNTNGLVLNGSCGLNINIIKLLSFTINGSIRLTHQGSLTAVFASNIWLVVNFPGVNVAFSMRKWQNTWSGNQDMEWRSQPLPCILASWKIWGPSGDKHFIAIRVDGKGYMFHYYWQTWGKDVDINWPAEMRLEAAMTAARSQPDKSSGKNPSEKKIAEKEMDEVISMPILETVFYIMASGNPLQPAEGLTKKKSMRLHKTLSNCAMTYASTTMPGTPQTQLTTMIVHNISKANAIFKEGNQGKRKKDTKKSTDEFFRNISYDKPIQLKFDRLSTEVDTGKVHMTISHAGGSQDTIAAIIIDLNDPNDSLAELHATL